METQEEIQERQVRSGHPAIVWLSVLLTLASWAFLAWGNGYVAMAIAAAAIIAAIIGRRHASPTIKRVSTTAIIASGILIVVVAAFTTALRLLI